MSEHLTQPERIAKLEVELGDAEDRVTKLEDDLEAARRCARLAQDAHDIVRARVAKLEAALQHARGVIEVIMSDGNCDCRKDFAIIDAALNKAAP